jgi:Tfp pilus assembly protein PilF
MADSKTLRQKFLIGIVLSFLVLVSYWGVTGNDFINYDDPVYVTENRYVAQGLGREGLIWAFTATAASNWHPLTWVSLMLDRVLFGNNAGGYHWTNVILHLMNALILFVLLERMTGRVVCSGLVAGLFAVHPLHVESVAWIAERKDVLSGLFWMLGLWGYGRYAEHPGLIRYGWVVLFFVMGLLSKPMVVTFPFVLLLLDWWPLKRVKLGRIDSAGDGVVVSPEGRGGAAGRVHFPEASISRLILEKIPLLVLSAAGCVITFMVQKERGAIASLAGMPLAERLINASVSYVAYLGKTFCPTDLSVFYPYHAPPALWQTAFAVSALTAVSLTAVILIRMAPYFVVGWFWYLGTLVPVIGIVQVGSQAMADRYTYLPLIGVFIIVIWGVADLQKAGKLRTEIGIFAAAAFLFLMMQLTIGQVQKWKNSETIFTDAIQNTDRNYQAHYLLGLALVNKGDMMGGMGHYREAVRIRPNFVQAHNSLGHLLMLRGEYAQAIIEFESAIRLRQDFAPALKNLGDVHLRQGKCEEAASLYRRALQYEQENPELLNNYGVALFCKGLKEEALIQILKAVRIRPDYAEARENLRKIDAER